ncbi:hypothetical protein ACFMBG_22020 [Leisingera sp. D0M16]|uniref:hypothetical protein n=1 Tax=Leisingera coralii TaxID=3351347 RepID=UPI003B807A7A
MTLARQLDTLRRHEDGCRLAAFGDLGASIVLRSSSAASHPQEYLDALCQQARRGFLLLDAAAQAGPEAAAPPADDILMLAPGEARLSIRAADGSGDALLCVCSDAETAARLAAPARALLASLDGGAG